MRSRTLAPPLGRPGLLELLEVVDRGDRLNPARAVFANRSLRMDGIEAIGFDMDYTLALYRMDAIERLAAECTVDKLIEGGYPKSLRRIGYDREFVIRGLVVDKRHGNLFKMDKHCHVGRVFHGFRRLSKVERRRVYRGETVRPSASRYHLVDTLFALPEVYLYAGIIDQFEREGRKDLDFTRLFHDIRAAIDQCHQDDSIKRVVLANISEYVQSDPALALTLHKFRSAGKKLFLLTNSYWHYSNALMGHLFNGVLPEYADWRNYFDLVLVGAKKPGFFAHKAPFIRLDEAGRPVAENPGRLERGSVYQGGNHVDLRASLDVEPDRILYVGDHIYGDVLRAKKASAWRTAMIVQEMEQELDVESVMRDRLSELVRLEHAREDLDEEVGRVAAVVKALQKSLDSGGDSFTPHEFTALSDAYRRARASLDQARASLHAKLATHTALLDEVDKAYNPYWGPLFKEGVENSVFGGQVEDYACVYTGRVSNFLRYSPSRYFRAPRDRMPHERH